MFTSITTTEQMLESMFKSRVPSKHARPPMAHSYRLGLVTVCVTLRYQVRIPVGPDICHRGCAFTVLQTVQRNGVYGAIYDTVHYREPLKSFEIRVGHSPGFDLPSVAILTQCAESDVQQYIHIPPGKHEAFSRCCFNVDGRWPNIDPTLVRCPVLMRRYL